MNEVRASGFVQTAEAAYLYCTGTSTPASTTRVLPSNLSHLSRSFLHLHHPAFTNSTLLSSSSLQIDFQDLSVRRPTASNIITGPASRTSSHVAHRQPSSEQIHLSLSRTKHSLCLKLRLFSGELHTQISPKQPETLEQHTPPPVTFSALVRQHTDLEAVKETSNFIHQICLLFTVIVAPVSPLPSPAFPTR